MNNELEIREIKIPLRLYQLLDEILGRNNILPHLIKSLNREVEKRILVRSEVLEILSHKLQEIKGFKKNEFSKVFSYIEKKIGDYSSLLQSLSHLLKRDFSNLRDQIDKSIDKWVITSIPSEFLGILNRFYNIIFKEYNYRIQSADLQKITQILQNDLVEIIIAPEYPTNRFLRFEYSLEDWLIRVLLIEIRERTPRVFRKLNSIKNDTNLESPELKKLNREQNDLSRYRVELLKLEDEIEITKNKVNSMTFAMPNLAYIITTIYQIEKNSELQYSEFEDPKEHLDPGEIFYQDIQSKLKTIIKNTITEYDMQLNFVIYIGDQDHSTKSNIGSAKL